MRTPAAILQASPIDAQSRFKSEVGVSENRGLPCLSCHLTPETCHLPLDSPSPPPPAPPQILCCPSSIRRGQLPVPEFRRLALRTHAALQSPVPIARCRA